MCLFLSNFCWSNILLEYPKERGKNGSSLRFECYDLICNLQYLIRTSLPTRQITVPKILAFKIQSSSPADSSAIKGQLKNSARHLNSEMFEWQKSLFFISLNCVAVTHNGRFQILLKEIFYFNSLLLVFYREHLSVKRSEMSAEW